MLFTTLPLLSYTSLCGNVKVHGDDGVKLQQNPFKKLFSSFPQAEMSVENQVLLEQIVGTLKEDQSEDWVSYSK